MSAHRGYHLQVILQSGDGSVEAVGSQPFEELVERLWRVDERIGLALQYGGDRRRCELDDVQHESSARWASMP